WSHVAVWTGTEMLIWGGNDHQQSWADGAAYNPKTNSWRSIPSAPMSGTAIPAMVWTGHEMLVLGGLAVFGGGGVARGDGAAYDPVSNTWRSLPPPPPSLEFTSGVWTGKLAVFIGNNPDVGARVAAYDPAANRWLAVSGVQLDAIQHGAGRESPVGFLVWDGHDVLV